MDEYDIGGATSPVTGLIRCLHRHRTGRAAPAPNTPDPLEIRQPPTDFADPYTQGVGKVGLGGWSGDQVDGSSGASGHGSGGGGDGGCGAVGQADEADGEVAQGGRDQRVCWRCAAGGGPRP